MNNTSPVHPVAAAAGRAFLAALFLVSGISKLFMPAMIQGYIASAGLPFPSLVYAITVVIEVGGGALLLVGYRTRLIAGVLAAFTVAAAIIFHHAFGDPDQFVHFMKNLAITGGLFYVAAVGAGAFSLDGYTPQSRRAPA
jgi:putative oxidoreductase